ncbi:hypothetical protein VIGAN_03122300, partial [Vigna angularis var. angularis]
FSPSRFGSRRGFCSEKGRAGERLQIFLHEFAFLDILFESFPLGDKLSLDISTSRSSSIQSPGFRKGKRGF